MAEIPQNPLSEVSANDATGVTLEIYRSIEAALGVRLVNLVYRHLATKPGALEWAWGVVGEGFSNGAYGQRSALLTEMAAGSSVGREVVGTISLAAAGLNSVETSAVIETLDAYNRANPMNAVSLRVIALALREGLSLIHI